MLKKGKEGQKLLQHHKLEEKMINTRQHTAIKELYVKGTPKKAIARLLGVDIKTVRRHLKKDSWTAYNRTISCEKNLLEDYKSWLLGRMQEINYNGQILYRELKLKGYVGSYETVKRFIHPYREEKPQAWVRYETLPGEQSQVDWGSEWVWLGDTQIKVHFFTFVLGYSRRLYAKGYLDEKLMSLINAHEEAFRWFGGITHEILYDNAKTMVTVHNPSTKELILNKQFEDFSHYYGFEAKFCHPYRPQTKGKIEAGVKYLKRNFLPGRRFRDLNHLNEELERWILEVADKRLHGTTYQRPIDLFAEESLISIKGASPYQYIPAIQRKVSQDSMVSFGSNRYSVPWKYVGRCADLRVSQNQLLVNLNGSTIAIHPMLTGKHEQSVLSHHYHGLVHVSHKPKKPTLPHHDPYWKADEEEMVRDLGVYEKAALLHSSFLEVVHHA